MTFEDLTTKTQDHSDRILALLPGLAQVVESAQHTLPEILQLSGKHQAREAYRWYILLAEEAEHVLEELFKEE